MISVMTLRGTVRCGKSRPVVDLRRAVAIQRSVVWLTKGRATVNLWE
jgi:hypothetical protein